MPLELYKTHSSLTCTCSLRPGPQRAISRTLALAAPDSGGHAVPCSVSGLGEGNSPKAKCLPSYLPGKPRQAV